MRDAHLYLGWFVVVSNAVVGAMALAAQWQPRLRHRALWYLVGVAHVSVAVQVALGVAYQETQDVEGGTVHLFYGFVALTVVGLIFSYRHQLAGYVYALFGGGSLFIAGLALRAVFNAGGV